MISRFYRVRLRHPNGTETTTAPTADFGHAQRLAVRAASDATVETSDNYPLEADWTPEPDPRQNLF